MNKYLFTLLALMVWMALPAQTTPEEVKSDLNKSGGVYYAYPTTVAVSTPAPEGYKPFHISHYGRHGSRYLISDNDYIQVSDLLHRANNAGALTPLGRDVMMRLDSVMIETAGRGGDLSPLGVRQHKGIAKRMIAAYPEVFTDKADISARSTVVIRCVLSMDAFCEGLKEVNPNLDITRESSNRYMNYLNYHSPESQEYTSKEWKEEYRKFEEEHTNPERLVASIFSDDEFVRKNVNPNEFMWGMYWLASGMQDIETQLSFYDIFTPDELFDLWQCFNYRFYVCDGNYAGNRGLLVDNAKPLMRNVLESAEAAIARDEPTVTLRFGHDGNLIPYAALLQLDGCYASVDNPDDFYKVFSDFKIAPMAGNIQLIFFRNNDGDVLVKFLHNEVETSIPVKTDIWPFYHWADVKRHLETQSE